MRSQDYDRLTYTGDGLEDFDSVSTTCLATLEQWWVEAIEDKRVSEPSAAALATYDLTEGIPDCRILLVKDFDRHGLRFFTNRRSEKGTQLTAHPTAALTLLWHPMFRQVRFRGPVERTTREEDLLYWRTRPRESQLASWVSHQSQPISSRAAMIGATELAAAKLLSSEVPLPDDWGGYRLRPVEVEFWVGMPARLHDRLRWRSRGESPRPLDAEEGWECQRLQP